MKKIRIGETLSGWCPSCEAVKDLMYDGTFKISDTPGIPDSHRFSCTECDDSQLYRTGTTPVDEEEYFVRKKKYFGH